MHNFFTLPFYMANNLPIFFFSVSFVFLLLSVSSLFHHTFYSVDALEEEATLWLWNLLCPYDNQLILTVYYNNKPMARIKEFFLFCFDIFLKYIFLQFSLCKIHYLLLLLYILMNIVALVFLYKYLFHSLYQSFFSDSSNITRDKRSFIFLKKNTLPNKSIIFTWYWD